MSLFKNLCVKFLLVFFIGSLTATIAAAQILSQNVGEAAETKDTSVTEQTTDTDEISGEKTKKDAKDDETVERKTKQTDAKPPRFGGHVGIVIPIVTRGNNRTVSIADDFVIGFPFALVVRTNSPVAFDFEFVPTIDTPSNQDVRFLLHPGVVCGFKKHYAAGVRAAYEFGTGNYGFTPIANRSFKLKDNVNYFIEADFPVRRERRPDRSRFASFGFAVHTGISF